MKSYHSYIFERPIDWKDVPIAEINSFHWEADTPYRPKSYAQLAAMKAEGLYVRMWSFEEKPRCIYTKDGDPVYRDSCLECFFTLQNPVDESPCFYINFEMNANAVLLTEFGNGRGHARRKTEHFSAHAPQVTPFSFQEDSQTAWGVLLFIPEALLSDLYNNPISFETITLYGNFYKCGDDTETPHFAAFSPVDSEALGFHNPARFAKISLTLKK